MCGVTDKWLLNPITWSILTTLRWLAGRTREIEGVEKHHLRPFWGWALAGWRSLVL